MHGRVEEAAQQLEFYHEIEESLGRSAVWILYITSIHLLETYSLLNC